MDIDVVWISFSATFCSARRFLISVTFVFVASNASFVVFAFSSTRNVMTKISGFTMTFPSQETLTDATVAFAPDDVMASGERERHGRSHAVPRREPPIIRAASTVEYENSRIREKIWINIPIVLRIVTRQWKSKNRLDKERSIWKIMYALTIGSKNCSDRNKDACGYTFPPCSVNISSRIPLV